MDALTLARWQFGVTTVYHFFFVPLTLGLVWVVAALQTAWYVTGQEVWKRLTKFWGKLFLINFAMGVATGIVQEFQFGMNWSEYSRFVGDVFGAPLAIEALLAFFLESTFLGLWIFGWDKLPKKAHLASIWLVAIGSNISALWILIANSFMQQPMGYALRNGRAEMDELRRAHHEPPRLRAVPPRDRGGHGHRRLLRARHQRLAPAPRQGRRDDRTPSGARSTSARCTRFVATVAVMVVGHTQAQYMMRVQPMKMAAAEALWESENPAAMSLFTWGNEAERTDVWAVRVPGLLSFLAYNRFEGEVRGIKAHPGRVRGEVRSRRLRAAGEVVLLELPRDGGGRNGDALPRRLGSLGSAARHRREKPAPARSPRARDRAPLRRQQRRAGSSPRSAGPPGSCSE